MKAVTVLHWSHNWGGGTQKYIDELCKLFPGNQHIVINGPPFQLNPNEIDVLHIHSTMVGQNIGWEILNLVKLLENKKIILSIHDYQWLFPHCPNPTTEEFEYLVPPIENVNNFKQLLNACDIVYMHTQNVLDRYQQFCGPLKNVTISHPCDVPVYYENLFVQSSSPKIKIGFLGGNAQHKGYYQFMDLARKFGEFEFHVYGCDIPSSLLISHGKYNDDKITQQLKNDGIHILLALSLSEETYCYALTRMINTGIPIVYLNRGSFKSRLAQDCGLAQNNSFERFFPVDNLCDLGEVLLRAVKYVETKEPIDKFEEDQIIQIPIKYKNIYTI